MRAIEFLIEETFEGGGRGYVVARVLDPAAQFVVSPDATLGGCPIEQWLDMPRALDAGGRQQRDLFGFCLKENADLARLKTGDLVVLT